MTGMFTFPLFTRRFYRYVNFTARRVLAQLNCLLPRVNVFEIHVRFERTVLALVFRPVYYKFKNLIHFS